MTKLYFKTLRLSHFIAPKALVPLIALIHLIVLLPILNTPLGADDIWKSTSRYILESQNLSLLDDSFNKMSYWIQHGRMVIVSSGIEPFLFYLTSHRILYKSGLILLIGVLHFAVYCFLRISGISKNSALYSILLLLSLSQLRNYFDPRIHFAGAILLSCLFLIIALIFLMQIVNESDRGFSSLGYIAFTFLAIFSYETNIAVLMPFSAYLIFKYHKVISKSKLVVIAIPILMGTFASLSIRFRAKYIENDATISYDLSAIFHTLDIQLRGTIPSSNFNGLGVIHFGKPTLFALAVILLTFFALHWKNKNWTSVRVTPTLEIRKRDLRIIGFLLVAIPSLLISLTPRFQSEIFSGLPYVSVLFQQVGLAIIVSTFVSQTKLSVYFSRMLIVVFIGTTVSSNYWITKTPNPFVGSAMIDNQKFGWDREIVERYFKSKVIKGGEKYFTYPQRAWTTTAYLSGMSGKKVEILNQPEWWGGSDVAISNNCFEKCGEVEILLFKGWNYDSGVISVSPFQFTKFDTVRGIYLASEGEMYIDGINTKCRFVQSGNKVMNLGRTRVSVQLEDRDNHVNLKFRTLDSSAIDPVKLANEIRNCGPTT